MGILDKNKSPASLSKSSNSSPMQPQYGLVSNGPNQQQKQQYANSSHLKANGNKKATYSFLNNNNAEVSAVLSVFSFLCVSIFIHNHPEKKKTTIWAINK